DQLMRDVSFIADVAVLPRWIRVTQLLDYVAGVHPKFDRSKAEDFLAKTTIKRTSKVRQLSKGMVAQLHLALVMAIDAKLLVLDEPTLGLDILYRKQFYDSLLNDYFDRNRTILLATHQVDEVQHVLTDLMFIDRGRIVFNRSMEEVESSYWEVRVNPDKLAAARRFYWSLRREFWESRSIYLAPLAVALLFLLGFAISTVHLPGEMRAAAALDPVKQQESIAQPYDFAAALLMLSLMIVGAFYSL